jgi:hypothetical protein
MGKGAMFMATCLCIKLGGGCHTWIYRIQDPYTVYIHRRPPPPIARILLAVTALKKIDFHPLPPPDWVLRWYIFMNYVLKCRHVCIIFMHRLRLL